MDKKKIIYQQNPTVSEKNSWQQNLIWKNTWPLIFDIMFNTWQIFDKNLQQRSILSHSGRLLPFQKWNLKPSHTKRKPLEGGRREAGGAENIMGSGEGRGVVADFYLIYLKLTNMSK